MSLTNPKVFLRAKDPETASDISNIVQYQTLLQQGDFTGALNFLKSMQDAQGYPNGLQMNINATRYNEIIDEITNIENFLLQNVEPYIEKQITRYKDINIYDSSVTYDEGNIVSYNGNLYRCIASSSNKLPTDTTYWNIFVQNQEQYPVTDTQPSSLVNGDIWFEIITPGG